MEKKDLPIKDLKLDLHNYRTVPQPDERSAIQAMIEIASDQFHGLIESILDYGILPIENIIVIRSGLDTAELIVREGNRRIAALKLALGLIPSKGFNLHESIKQSIKHRKKAWITANSVISCLVYDAIEEDLVDRIVAVTHGKGERAGRDDWPSVAKARHNRDKNKASQLDLDLLEQYLMHGQNLSEVEKARWAGDYSLTVLDEAIKRIYPRLGFSTLKDLVGAYPEAPAILQHRAALESLLRAIGTKDLGFKQLRDSRDHLGVAYGIPPLPSPNKGTGTASQGTVDGETPSAKLAAGETPDASKAAGETPDAQSAVGEATDAAKAAGEAPDAQRAAGEAPGANQAAGEAPQVAKVDGEAIGAKQAAGESPGAGKAGEETPGANQTAGGTRGTSGATKGPRSSPTNEPRAVMNALKKFRIHGSSREKVSVLLKESRTLDLVKQPHAFCFVLRSMFEISAKVYCGEQNPPLPTSQSNGNDKSLVNLLREVTDHMTEKGQNKEKAKVLHGAMAELGKKDGFLSVTSMNQLVHNPSFTVDASHISTLFFNVFPLLQAMNS